MIENDLTAVEDNCEVVDAVQSNNDQSNSTSIPKHHVSFSNLTNNPEIKRDSEFLDKMQQIWPMITHQSSSSSVYLNLGNISESPT